jgi:hypothetical protein
MLSELDPQTKRPLGAEEMPVSELVELDSAARRLGVVMKPNVQAQMVRFRQLSS